LESRVDAEADLQAYDQQLLSLHLDFEFYLQPWVSEHTRDFVSITGIVEVHDVVHVLKIEPVIAREQVQGDGFIATELLPFGRRVSKCPVTRSWRGYLHSYNIVGCKVEAGSLVLETLHDWLRVNRSKFLGQSASLIQLRVINDLRWTDCYRRRSCISDIPCTVSKNRRHVLRLL
jgi:hypothetical protein